MKPLNQSVFLTHLSDQIRSQEQLVTGSFSQLEAAVLLAPSDSGGWSIIQCLDHLNSYSRHYLPHFEAQLRRQQPAVQQASGIFRSSFLGSYFTKMMDPAVSRKRYKAHPRHIPAAMPDTAGVLGEFTEHQQKLHQCLAACAGRNLRKMRSPLSIAPFIRINAGDIAHFLVVHNERHLQQALRNLHRQASIYPTLS